MHIIQIGCHTGNDPFFSFFQEHQNEIEKCVIADALSSSVDICENHYKSNISQENFKKITFLRKAIVSDPEVDHVDFFVTENEHEDDKEVHYTAFSSTSENHLLSHGVKNIKKLEVPSITLTNLLKDSSITKADRLYLDAEGLDAKILLSLDFSAFELPFVCFENSHTDGAFVQGDNGQRLYSKFKNNEYDVFTFLHKGGNYGYVSDQYDWNCWAIKKGQEALLEDVVRFSGHEAKVIAGHSNIVQL